METSNARASLDDTHFLVADVEARRGHLFEETLASSRQPGGCHDPAAIGGGVGTRDHGRGRHAQVSSHDGQECKTHDELLEKVNTRNASHEARGPLLRLQLEEALEGVVEDPQSGTKQARLPAPPAARDLQKLPGD